MARSNVAAQSDPLHWWNPRKLILQIVLLQLAYTLTATILITFLVLVMGAPFRIDYIFLDTSFRRDIVFGWSLAFLSILASLFTVLYLVLIVRRSAMIVDFVLTLEGMQLFLTVWYNWHFPTTLLWWITRGVETGIMIFGGQYFCRMRELRPIEFGMYEMVSQQPPDLELQVQQQNGDSNSAGGAGGKESRE